MYQGFDTEIEFADEKSELTRQSQFRVQKCA